MAGILAAHYARFSPAETAIGFVSLLAIGIAARFLAPRCAWIGWIGCVLFAGIGFAEWHRPAPPPELEAQAGESLLVSGCVVEPLAVRDGRGRFTVEIEQGARAAVTFRPDGTPPSLPYGSVVEFTARVRAPR